MFWIRDARPSDLDQIHEVARHLNTVNLPDDRDTIAGLLEMSRRSFSGEIETFAREYLFVLEDLDAKRIIGTSMIHAQHGTRRAAHVYFAVENEEHYSHTLDKYVVHQILCIGYNYNGPTEIGGLILLPEYRGHVEALGKLLSYVRFLYIGLHRAQFRDELLSELLPPLEADGTSLLWESLGRHFTGLSYQEADRLSSHNKEFIQALFPQTPIYTSLLPANVQALVGQVGPKTKGVEKMLRRIGFEYANRIDPFDGGPHFTAKTDDVTLVAGASETRVAELAARDEKQPYTIVACAREGGGLHFAAVGTHADIRDGELGLDPDARGALGVKPGDRVGYVVP